MPKTYAGLTLEEISKTHKDNELVRALVAEVVKHRKPMNFNIELRMEVVTEDGETQEDVVFALMQAINNHSKLKVNFRDVMCHDLTCKKHKVCAHAKPHTCRSMDDCIKGTMDQDICY